ncbi:MAG: hypothetical protein WBF73_18160 [Bradyrhizobium sp.]|jgi:hypothetical protein
MWAPFRNLLVKSKTLGSLLGDVLFETPPLKGQSSHSTFQWRVKKSLDEKSFYVSLKLIADGHVGPEGSPTNYINFDLATAQQIKADLDDCIAMARQLAAQSNAAARRAQ